MSIAGVGKEVMLGDQIKTFLKEHPQVTNALFGGLVLAQTGLISTLGNHGGTAGP